jgi:hypothetical protein
MKKVSFQLDRFCMARGRSDFFHYSTEAAEFSIRRRVPIGFSDPAGSLVIMRRAWYNPEYTKTKEDPVS